LAGGSRKDKNAPIIIVRRKSHGEGHHGGAWKVALADFMTAMFCLFLVLWLINQSSDVKSAIAGYFQDPLGRADEYGSSIMPGEGAQSMMVRPRPQTDVLNLRRDRLQAMAKQIEKKIEEVPELKQLRNHIEVFLTDDGLRIELIEDSSGTFFAKGKADPTSSGQNVLKLIGAELGALTLPVRIEGHTDALPYRGSTGYSNWELSADRANAARRILTESGVRPELVTQVSAMADRDLRVPDDPFSPRNRRVTITMLLESPAESAGPPSPVPLDTLQ
jgi:chemotaxis protein MotB